MKIALLGAESTGKSQLTQALYTHLQQSGLAVYRVDEYLREWCDTHQRVPSQHEQAHVAETQMARVLDAPKNSIVVTDTTPLMIAVYSQWIFGDHSLDAQALAWQQQFDITLLTGLDLPWIADVLRDGPQVREPVDQMVRHMLARANVSYQVVYGQGAQRLENALFCIAGAAAKLSTPTAARLCQVLSRPEVPAKWTGPCETCGDGDCEHRLFRSLVKS